ncbi:MAG: DUF2085 domain-containing protein [Bacteroidota bacterium]
MNLQRLTYLAIAIGAALWCALIALPPAIAASSDSLADTAALLASFFRPVCHQIDGRSLTLFGEPLAVCARCSAIYGAFLLGTLLYPLLRSVEKPVMPPRWLLIVALIPMLADAIPGMIGIHEVSTATRVITGAIFGAVLPFVILPAAIEGVGQLFTRFTPSTVHHKKGMSDA